MTEALSQALDSLQEWADAHPEHLEAIFGHTHALTRSGQEAIDGGLNFFGARLVVESFHRANAQYEKPLDSVTIYVPTDREGQPDYWLTVSRNPVYMGDLLQALRNDNGGSEVLL